MRERHFLFEPTTGNPAQMCGIIGVWWPAAPREAEARAIALRMADAIRHAGPDAGGAWVDADAGLALAHRRLSILDRSPAGAQPMVSPSGRFVIVYNGEIYNHLDLRRLLNEGGSSPSWRGHSDTETLLAGIEHWGLETCLDRICGMFAFALWDRLSRSLTLVRDRIGEKPALVWMVWWKSGVRIRTQGIGGQSQLR